MTAAVQAEGLTVVSKPRVPPALRNILEGIAIGIILTALSYFVGAQAGWITEVNLLEAFAVFTSYASTYLCVRERRFNYVFGIISTAAYCVVFWQFGLIASAAVNAYLVPTLIYGWFRWGKDENTRPVHNLQWRWLPVYLLVTAAVYFGAVYVVGWLGGSFAPADAMILVGTILAQFMLDNKVIQTWFVWAGVNVAAIYVYFSAGLALAGFQYIFFLLNAGYGLYMWRKSMKEKEKEPEALTA